MFVEYHNKLNDPVKQQCSRVVVYDIANNPISVTIELAEGMYVTKHAGESDFNETLDMLGITRINVDVVGKKDLVDPRNIQI